MAPAASLSQLLCAALLSGSVGAFPGATLLQQHLQQQQQPLQHSQPQTQSHSRKLQGRFLHITDFHPDQFYKPHTSTDEETACHRGKGIAGTYGAETSDCDSPYSLVNATFDWIKHNLKDEIDFIVWTGDTARHDSDEEHPRSRSEVIKSNRVVADGLVETLSDSDGKLTIPVVPTFGNNDFLPHNIFYPGPNPWLHSYSETWRRFIPEEQRHTFQFGGWFYVEVIPDQLVVFSLNTMYFFDRNAAVDGCADPSEPGFQHMEWLRVQLQRLREMGMKAILTGHVPPARTKGKSNWDETCWQRYTLWVQQYRDVVTGSVYGHMNIDHFLLQDTNAIDLTLAAQGIELPAEDNDDTEQEMSIQSKTDYLEDLREEWADLPDLLNVFDEDEEEDALDIDASGKKDKKKKKKKNKKLKKIGGKYGERYHLSLVSPSVVPNYFPSIRVIEYNMTGLEDTKVWEDTSHAKSTAEQEMPELLAWESEEESKPTRQELRRRDSESSDMQKTKKDKKNTKNKDGPSKDGKDPHLVIPDDPKKKSLPGPAYFPQPFTFTGYIQYFANLTHINNDVTGSGVEETRWSGGHHADKTPQHKSPKPRKFEYEVEYSTFDDEIYKLSDLTVKSYLKLAYRIGQSHGKSKAIKSGSSTPEDAEELEVLDESDDNDSFAEEEEDDVELSTQGKKKKKKNKAWLHFLKHAFVATIPEDELDD